MTAGVLDVLIAGKLAGTLSQDGAGSLSFAYERGYCGMTCIVVSDTHARGGII